MNSELTNKNIINKKKFDKLSHDKSMIDKLEHFINLKCKDNNIYILENNYIRQLKKETLEKFIWNICQEMKLKHLDVKKITNNIFPKLKNINTIKDINEQIISISTEMITDHYDYPCIGMWILINNLHENTESDYLKVVKLLRNNINKVGEKSPIVSKEFSKFVKEHHIEINKKFRYDRDYHISIFGFRTLEKSYLKKSIDGKLYERPQHLYMRVAIAVHYRSDKLDKLDKLDKIFETYDLLSKGYFIHATPTLYNAATTHEQLSSCFLLGIEDDMDKIGECWKDCAIISKNSGGIGINVTNIRVDGAYIHSTQGRASGLRVLSVFDKVARYADQGGKRSGSIAIYIEPWHGDIFFFLDLKKNTGAETERARDLFLALIINDVFMKRVENDEIWSLMCPSECPNLLNKYGKEFTKIYIQYETEKKYLKQVRARELWFKIMESQIESGVPYIVFKDHINYKSNQSNIGVINGSNLCVSGDTMILTSKGYFNISSLENLPVKVWNGEEFNSTIVKRTGKNKNLIKIFFSNGSSLKCTYYHNFYITTTGSDCIKKNANELVLGDKLINTKYPVVLGKSTSKSLNSKKIPLTENIMFKLNWIYLHDNFKIEDQENYFLQKGQIVIKFTKKNINYQNKCKYLFQTLGCDPQLFFKKYYYLIFEKSDIKQLLSLGFEFSSDFMKIINDLKESEKSFIVVKKIKYLKKTEDTFCFTEPNRNMGIFNGIIAGNCAEIVEYSSADEYAVCNLASICLPKFVKSQNGKTVFDYSKLCKVTQVVCRNLNNIIDINYYPLEKMKISNMKYRPIGIGVQGLADVFALFKIPFDSEISRQLNKNIFETIYFGALSESMLMAKENGPYKFFKGSPLSEGKFQFNLWNIDENKLSGMWDWNKLRNDIMASGVYNSLVTTCMPTASTSQIKGNNECIEPYTENIYTRSTLAGDYYVINKHLMKDLMDLGIWNSDIIDLIKYYNGSISKINIIPQNIKDIYRTVWEIPQKSIIEMAADRGPYVDQTQSMNIFLKKPNFVILNSCLFYSWRKGLKTGIYYLRSKASSEANQFGIDINKIKEIKSKYTDKQNTCKIGFNSTCHFCSS